MDAVDRISNLPPNITEHILQRVPLKDAIRTSVLSTCWRYKWAILPKLILNYHFLSSIREEFDVGPISSAYSSEAVDALMLEYSNVVNNILLCHDGSIHEFILYIPSWFTRNADISRWIHFVSRKLVKKLTLYKDLWGQGKVPSTMFSCVEFNHLTHLALVHWSLPSISTTFSGFACLISLQLQFHGDCSGEANKIGIVVSKCPLLENLYLMIHEDEGCLTIHAPKLQNLVVDGSLGGIFLEETERIKMLYLNVVLDHKRYLMMDILSCLPLVEKLILGKYFWLGYYLPVDQPLGKLNLPNKMSELKSLRLDDVRLHSQWTVTCMLGLFQMSPKLQFLEIKVDSLREPDPSKSKVEGDCCLDHLKTANISTTHYKGALLLIHMLLSSSPVLEKMTVKAEVFYGEEFNIAKELSEFRRASANAEIIFEGTDFYFYREEYWY